MLLNMLPCAARANLPNSAFRHTELFGEKWNRSSAFFAGPNSRYAIDGENVVPIDFTNTTTAPDEAWEMRGAQPNSDGVRVVFSSSRVLKIRESVVGFNAVNVVNPSLVFSAESFHNQSMNLSSDDPIFTGKPNLSVPFVGKVWGEQRVGTAMSPCNDSFDSAKVGYCISRTFLDSFPLFYANVCFGGVAVSHLDSPTVGLVDIQRTVYTNGDEDSTSKANAKLVGV